MTKALEALERMTNVIRQSRDAHVLDTDVETIRSALQGEAVTPLPINIKCPECGVDHVDEGEWATRPHKTHQCQSCGHEWRPFPYPTVGVPGVPVGWRIRLKTNKHIEFSWLYGEERPVQVHDAAYETEPLFTYQPDQSARIAQLQQDNARLVKERDEAELMIKRIQEYACEAPIVAIAESYFSAKESDK